MPVDFQDIATPGEGIEETLDILQVGWQSHRTCIVAWDDRWTFINEHFLEAWPYHGVNAYCVKGKAKPFPEAKNLDGGSGKLDFEYALVTLYYTTNVFSAGSGIVGWERLRGATDSVPLRCPDNTIFWNAAGGDAVVTGDAPSFLTFPGMTYERGYSGISAIPVAAGTLIGGCNAAPVTATTLGITFATETIRYVDFSADRHINAAGTEKWKLVYYYHFKPNVDSGGTARGWNWFWRPEVNDFQPVYNASVQVKPVPPVDLTLLNP